YVDGAGIHVAHEYSVVIGNRDTTARGEGPSLDEFAITVKNRNALIAAVVDDNAPLRIHRHAVWHLQLPRTFAFLAPNRADELAVGRHMHDARVHVTVGNEEIAVRGECHVVGFVEEGLRRVVARFIGRTEGLYYLAVEIELVDHMTGGIGRPQITFGIIGQAVRVTEKAVFAPTGQQFPITVMDADVRCATHEHQNFPLTVCLNPRGGAIPFPGGFAKISVNGLCQRLLQAAYQ